MTVVLTQNNFLSVMDEIFAIDKDWATVYGKIKLQLNDPINKNNLFFDKNNLAPLFCHELMSRRISIKQFKRVINFIYQTSDENVLFNFFSQFFHIDINISLFQNFCKSKRKNSNLKVVEIIQCDFLDFKNNQPCLYEKNIKYLDIILKEIGKKEMPSLYKGSFELLLGFVINDKYSLSQLITITNKNYHFSNNDFVRYKNFTGTCLNLFHVNTKQHNSETLLYSYQILKKQTTQFNEQLKKSLICFNNKNSNNLFLDSRILAICIKAQEDVFSIINAKYLMEFKNLKKDNYTLQDHDFYYGAYFRDIYPNLKLKEYIHFDWTCFDIEKTAYENAVYIQVFENNLKHGYKMNVPIEINIYLIKFCNNFDNKDNSFKEAINFDLIKRFCNYYEINQILNEKKSVLKPVKI